ncbi:uncharacterized protein PHACADRAFT_214550 [Phanerochaete carnosa HHB-10118-sp]|uniref:Arrestin-like N-terminal domain-containing protein n=1 Tax=Phanerochaete carnosa (strain HHB-10118-sp) TaxID=650164 RepID=K5VD05_PHACS|nr:uncharacterized protein PHACADRAFT_214550 [Phanerochaete carnosa HHB-10118-sp]EKM48998.1 hypothetical protein PHACADRAFT_214550 [Phanerochaete carnosa HHB-10118-sp]
MTATPVAYVSEIPSSPPPPAYSPPDASPPYASEPSEDEERLDFVARAIHHTPRSVYVKKARRVCVVLKNQENGLATPVYARHSLVAGEVLLEDRDVCSVSIKLEGRQTMALAEGRSSSRVLFTTEFTLWQKGEQAQSPRAIPFAVPFPPTYTTKSGEFSMPPSFETRLTGAPGLRAQILYSLTIRLTRPPLSLWKRHTKIVIPVKYQPRSRPYLPISPGLYPFLSTVKTAPEEWRQISSTVPSCDDSVDPIECHLFVPSVQIYGLTDTIPFHLQINGPAKSLSFLLGLSMPRPASKSPNRRKWSRNPSSFKSPYPSTELSMTVSRAYPEQAGGPTPTKVLDTCAQSPWSVQHPYLFVGGAPEDLAPLRPARAAQERNEFVLRVYLLRQVSARVNGLKAWRNAVIGEGAVWPVGGPPDIDCDGGDGAAWSALDWAGELRVDKDVETQSFAVGDLSVKDFIVVHLSPPHSDSSPFLEMQLSHPIRLVTDTYRDNPDTAAR